MSAAKFSMLAQDDIEVEVERVDGDEPVRLGLYCTYGDNDRWVICQMTKEKARALAQALLEHAND